MTNVTEPSTFPRLLRIWTTGAVLVASIFAIATGAQAADWTVKSQISEGLEVNDNRSLSSPKSGTTLKSISRLTVDATKILPTFRFSAGADVSYRHLEGDDAANAAPTDNGVRFSSEIIDKLTKYSFIGSWRRQDAVSAQLEDAGLVTIRGNINTFALQGGAERQLGPLNSLSFSTRGTIVDFDSGNGTPYVDILATTTWTSRQTQTTKFFRTLQLELLNRDDVYDTQTKFVRASTGLESQLSRQLTFRGSVGGGWVSTERSDIGAGPVPPAGVILTSGSNFGFLTDLELSWRPQQGTRASILATHNLMPNVAGEIERRTSVGVEFSKALTRSSNLSVKGELGRQEFLDRVLTNGSVDYFRTTVTYGYQWTPEWQTRLAYKFAYRDDNLGAANSNALFLSIVRDFNIMGR